MRHTPNFVCKLCMSGITTASLQVQLLAAQARRSLHFPQLDSLLHELDELGSLHILNVRSSFVDHSSHTSFARRVLPLDARSSYTSARRSFVLRSTYAHGHHSHGQPRPVGTSTRTAQVG